ncbi:MAG: hypothetical protein F4Y31_10520 [Gammaproteobacteria bacterium]|nr:hypothetical protein [Gammaproteobacteria bacterium]MYF67302.1 hypothetical protein [Gammaproteobacteria bacterium]MYK36735.1 hypothetical protein [Gammaproteobacteria bacterium]
MKLALWAFVIVLGALLVLGYTGIARLETQPGETATFPLPESITQKNVCREDSFRRHCWTEVVNRPGCYTWVYVDSPDQEFYWSGECPNGLTEGRGVLESRSHLDLSVFVLSLLDGRHEGTLARGKRQGDWYSRYLGGREAEQPYLYGYRHGIRWVGHRNREFDEIPYILGRQSDAPIRYGPDGERIIPPWEQRYDEDWPYHEGYRHGFRLVPGTDGETRKELFVENSKVVAWGPAESDEEPVDRPFPDGGLTGRYRLRLAAGSDASKHYFDGIEAEGQFAHGVMQGEWTFRDPGGTVRSGRYQDNRPTGEWVEIDHGRSSAQGTYLGQYKHGDWVVRYDDGAVHEGPYEGGVRNGKWMMKEADGRVVEGDYRGDRPNGEWIYRYPDGKIETVSLLGGIRHGKWTTTLPDGTGSEGFYREGNKFGDWVVRRPDGTVIEEFWENGALVETASLN